MHAHTHAPTHMHVCTHTRKLARSHVPGPTPRQLQGKSLTSRMVIAKRNPDIPVKGKQIAKKKINVGAKIMLLSI